MKYAHKITTTEQITIEGLVNKDGTIDVTTEAGTDTKNISAILQQFTNTEMKIVITHKTDEELV